MLFKVGQRVRVQATEEYPWSDEAVIVGFDPALSPHTATGEPQPWIVITDTHPSDFNGTTEWPRGAWACRASILRPLTDPKADAFIERIKKLKPYDEPTVKPQTLEEMVCGLDAEQN